MKHYRHHWFYHAEPPEKKEAVPHWWHRGGTCPYCGFNE